MLKGVTLRMVRSHTGSASERFGGRLYDPPPGGRGHLVCRTLNEQLGAGRLAPDLAATCRTVRAPMPGPCSGVAAVLGQRRHTRRAEARVLCLLAERNWIAVRIRHRRDPLSPRHILRRA